MGRNRVVLVLVLLAGIALPLALPAAARGHPRTGEWPRAAALAFTTLQLVCGAVLLAVPAGTAAALALERGGVPGARLLRGVVVVGLFVPLSVYAAGWQAALGVVGLPDVGGWRPWREGLLPAIGIHAAAGLPWVVWFVGLALRTTDPALEDDAALTGGPAAVVRWVLWQRARAAALLAGCWVAVQCLTEVVVTDVAMVRTFAEEVYVRLVGDPAGVPAAVGVGLPVWAASAVLAVNVARRVLAAIPATDGIPLNRPLIVRNRAARLAATLVLWAGTFVLVGWPLAALAGRTGGAHTLVRVAAVHGPTLAGSLVWAAVAGVVAATLGLAACWAARQSRLMAGLVVAVAAAAWVTPAPLLGLGLKRAIDLLLAGEEAVLAALGLDPEFPPLRSLLYDQPSPAPAVWALVVRYFPVAVAVIWPAVRAIPQAHLDAAALDGGRAAARRAVVWPATWAAVARAAAAAAALGVGEVVATKLVEPPGRQSFAQELFNAMHYGADATVAAMALFQLAATTAAAALLLAVARPRRVE